MELLFVALFGSVIGIAVRYALPHREEHGVALVPSVGAIVAAIVWVGLTWLHFAWDAPWIWLVSLGAAAVASVAVAVLLGSRRSRADAAMLERLASGRAAA